ncbi:MAG: hypothetical protein YYHSYBAR_003356 [Candidatus Fervidibacter sacchari]
MLNSFGEDSEGTAIIVMKSSHACQLNASQKSITYLKKLLQEVEARKNTPKF